jgi:2,5-diamino-6-(ribosylamino)-4(3H)-pyrimidinone 5'-phosphate reductase
MPYWRDVLVLCSRVTPREYLDYLEKQRVEYIVAGNERVDLRSALEELAARHGVKLVRVDSGGTLNGALLRVGLVDEVSVLLHPCLVGGTTPQSLFRAPDLASTDAVIPLRLTHVKRLRGEVVWLRYEVVR